MTLTANTAIARVPMIGRATLDMTLARTLSLATIGTCPADAAPRPFWLATPCPPWCVAPHTDTDMAEDRVHESTGYEVVLTLEPWGEYADEHGPAHMFVHLNRHYRELGPHITVSVNGRSDITFTLAEAAELAAAIEHQEYRAAMFWETCPETSRPYWQDRPCPSWCDALHEDTDEPGPGRVHISDYQMVTLTLEDADLFPLTGGALRAQPQSILVRLEQGHREYEALVCLVYRDEYYELTPGEAQQLGQILNALVTEAAKSGAVQQ
jgi:hypothetical protein